jgi:hypothetical protein
MKHLNLFNSNSEYELHKNSSQYVTPEVSFIEETNTVFYVPKQELYEWVDLGLPSGTLWAAWNVGATKPEDFGLYFAWGETQGYSGVTDEKQFSISDYKWCNGTETTFTKYNIKSYLGTVVDNKLVLEQVDDAAYTSDNTCRMPTKAEGQELINNTTSTWETLNGINGRRFTSKTNGNSIFIPSAGVCRDGSVDYVGSRGYLWSNSLYGSHSGYAWFLVFESGNVGMYYDGSRYYGCSIRPVKSK